MKSSFSGGDKGFAVSLDTFFAIILLIGLMAYLGLGMNIQEQDVFETGYQMNAKQMLDDAITAMDNNGFLGKTLVDSADPISEADANEIYFHLKDLLPSNMDANITITRFEPTGLVGDTLPQNCRDSKSFNACFLPGPLVVTAGKPIDTNKNVFSGTQYFMKRQPYIRGATENTCIPESELEEKNSLNGIKAFFDGETTITTKVSVDLASMHCYDTGINPDETAIVKLSEKSGQRTPIAVMTVIDKSGSMSKLDMQIDTASGSFDSGACLPNPPGTCSTSYTPSNCGNYTNWLLDQSGFPATYTVTSEISNYFAASPSWNDNLVFWNHYTSYSGSICTPPKIRVVSPANTYCYGTSSCSSNPSTYVNSSNRYVKLVKGVLRTIGGENNYGQGLWNIDLWSDNASWPASGTTIYRPMWVSFESTTSSDMRTASILAQPVVSDQTNCYAAPANGWTKIGEINFTGENRLYYLSTLVYHNYNYPEGVCGVVLRIKKPDGLYSSVSYSKNSPVTINLGNNDSPFPSGTTETLLPQGLYEIEAWTDKPMTVTSIRYSYKLLFGKIEPATINGSSIPPYPSASYDAGTCAGIACYGSGTATCNYPDSSTYANLDVNNVTRSLRGLRADITASGYNGNCYYPRFKLTSPTGSDSSVLNGSKPNSSVCITVNRNTTYDQSSCGTNMAISDLIGNWTAKGWSDESTDFSVNWKEERIDAAIQAAELFVQNESWEEQDKMGIVSYSTTPNLRQSMTPLDATGKNSLISTLNTVSYFNPDGETNIGDAIAVSTSSMPSGSYDKFIVLLSDGQANRPDEATAVAYAIGKADEARTAGITVYTIGFGSDVAANDLKDIAKDPCDSYSGSLCTARRADGKYADCFTDPENPLDLTLNLAKHCGRYYFALDPSSLQEIYAAIAELIGVSLPDAKIVVNPVEGMEICQCNTFNCGAPDCDSPEDWTSNAITFTSSFNDLGETVLGISGNDFANQYFKAKFLCTGTYCTESTVEFPPIDLIDGLRGTYIETGGTRYEWGKTTGFGTTCDPGCTSCTADCTRQIPFTFRDLAITLTSGTTGSGASSINFNISNNGEATGEETTVQIGFYKNEPVLANHLDVTAPAPASCSITPDANLLCDVSSLGTGGTVSFSNAAIDDIGYIHAVLTGAGECQLHDESIIYCLQQSKVYYFKIDYFAWVK